MSSSDGPRALSFVTQPVLRRQVPIGSCLAIDALTKAGFASEGHLARSILQGDALAKRVAWEQYVPLVRQIVRGVLGRGPEVDDVIQDVFLHLFHRVPTLRNPDSLQNFVRAFARRVASCERRQRLSRSWLVLTKTGRINGDRRFAVGDETRFDLWRLYKALDLLSSRERTVLLLRHLEGMTLNEIARAMQVSLATTKRAFRRASFRVMSLTRRAVALRVNRRAPPHPAPRGNKVSESWREPRLRTA